MLGKRKRHEEPLAVAGFEEPEIDPETGLIAAARFEECIEKEIARGLRYGSRSALALFEVAIADRTQAERLPSPAPFVAQVLRKAVRGSDVLARVSPSLFAALLIEAHSEGAGKFTERVRTGIGSHPYGRRPDGTALYARAWAGVAQWDPSMNSVGAYAGAAETALASTFRGYEAAQEWFRGEGTNKPFIA